MDAKGRKTAGLPGFLVLATGFGMLAAQFSAAIRTGLPGAVALMLSASLIGVGTGLTGSLNEVLCVDVAPKGVDQPKFVVRQIPKICRLIHNGCTRCLVQPLYLHCHNYLQSCRVSGV